jgi:hypothetical protein
MEIPIFIFVTVIVFAAATVGYYVWDDGTSKTGRCFAIFFWCLGLAMQLGIFFDAPWGWVASAFNQTSEQTLTIALATHWAGLVLHVSQIIGIPFVMKLRRRHSFG